MFMILMILIFGIILNTRISNHGRPQHFQKGERGQGRRPGEGAGGGTPHAQPGGMGERCKFPIEPWGRRSPRSQLALFALQLRNNAAPGSRPFTVQSSTYMLFIRVHCKNKVTTVVGTWQVDAGNFNASKMNQ